MQKRLDHYLKKMMAEEARMRRAKVVFLRPCSLQDKCFVDLRFQLRKEKKNEYLLNICVSVYLIKALRPLKKGRKGKGNYWGITDFNCILDSRFSHSVY
jgi:hypothetical protein